MKKKEWIEKNQEKLDFEKDSQKKEQKNFEEYMKKELNMMFLNVDKSKKQINKNQSSVCQLPPMSNKSSYIS